MWALLAYLIIDSLARGDLQTALHSLPLLAGIALFMYAVLWRPAVDVFSDRVVIRNPLRTVDAPFEAVRDVRAELVLRIVLANDNALEERQTNLRRAGASQDGEPTWTVTAWNAPGSSRARPTRGRGGFLSAPSQTASAPRPSESKLLVDRWESWQRHSAPDRRREPGPITVTRMVPLLLVAGFVGLLGLAILEFVL